MVGRKARNNTGFAPASLLLRQISQRIVTAFSRSGSCLILLHRAASQNSVAYYICDISCGGAGSGNVIAAG